MPRHPLFAPAAGRRFSGLGSMYCSTLGSIRMRVESEKFRVQGLGFRFSNQSLGVRLALFGLANERHSGAA